MNQFQITSRCVQPRTNVLTRVGAAVALTLGLGAIAGCSSVSDLTKERVARSSVAIQQTEQTVGRSEEGAVELQHAKEHFAAAEKAVARTDDKGAQHSASLAELHAELAAAQSQNADAQRGAKEVATSTEMLRTESERGSVAR
jgi:hypothetical protein